MLHHFVNVVTLHRRCLEVIHTVLFSKSLRFLMLHIVPGVLDQVQLVPYKNLLDFVSLAEILIDRLDP